jgi:exopolyphosphatase/guanosine-5'-triphosphate,3'-diphosphate pyrophosphatase
VSTRMLDRARVHGAALRLAYVISAAMPGVLEETTLAIVRHRLALRLPGQFSALAGERILNRLRSLARLIGREPVVLSG